MLCYCGKKILDSFNSLQKLSIFISRLVKIKCKNAAVFQRHFSNSRFFLIFSTSHFDELRRKKKASWFSKTICGNHIV